MIIYHKINQLSGNAVGTKPCRTRHEPCETLTPLHLFAADLTAVFYGCSSEPHRKQNDITCFGT